MSDPYEILGVKRDATDEELKKAYHTLVRRYHPDRFAGDEVREELANRKMREINVAYEAITAERSGGAPETPPPPPVRKEKKEAHKGGAAASGNGAATDRSFLGYPYIRTLLAGENFAAAYGELLHVQPSDRDAEWHYLAALSHRGLHHLHDALSEIWLACRRAPKNEEYRAAREEINRWAGKPDKKTRAERKADASAPKKRISLCKRCCFDAIGLDEDGKC